MADLRYFGYKPIAPQVWAKKRNLGFVDFDDISDSCYTCINNAPDICPVTQWFKTTERIRQTICDDYERRPKRDDEKGNTVHWHWPIRRIKNEA